MAKFSTELTSFHPHGFKACSSDTPIIDLRDYLTQKRSVYQNTLQCCCERLIMAVLFECHCGSHMSTPSVFKQLSVAPASNSAKRHCSRKKISFLTRSILRCLPTWWVQVLHQTSQKESNCLSVLKSLMLNVPRVLSSIAIASGHARS